MTDPTCTLTSCADGTQKCLTCATEEWRPVPGFELSYLVSDLGRVKSLPRTTTPGGLLRQKVSKRGYFAVGLVQGGKQTTHEVHRLVAAAFFGPRPDLMEVRHLDGNPLNCVLGNLVYGTRSENVRDKRRHGTDHNLAKTHCPQNHPYDEANTIRIPSRPTARYCRECKRERERSRRARTARP